MNKTDRIIVCPICEGDGRVCYEEYPDELFECDNCHGEGYIDNPEYWRALLPKPILFKEGREAQLEYYNLKTKG